jgi:hypothetical protein
MMTTAQRCAQALIEAGVLANEGDLQVRATEVIQTVLAASEATQDSQNRDIEELDLLVRLAMQPNAAKIAAICHRLVHSQPPMLGPH